MMIWCVSMLVEKQKETGMLSPLTYFAFRRLARWRSSVISDVAIIYSPGRASHSIASLVSFRPPISHVRYRPHSPRHRMAALFSALRMHLPFARRASDPQGLAPERTGKLGRSKARWSGMRVARNYLPDWVLALTLW